MRTNQILGNGQKRTHLNLSSCCFPVQPTMEELNEKITALKSELLSPSEAPAQQQLAKEDKLVKLQVALHWMKEVCSPGGACTPSFTARVGSDCTKLCVSYE